MSSFLSLRRGVKVLFNQASTGYVSGISYSYQGMVMQGSKLGNGFKWSTVKNIINYEQERDRQRIHACPPKLQRRREANVRSEHAINQLRAGNNHAGGNTANTQGSVVKYGQLPDSGKTHGLNIFSRHSQLKSLDKQFDSLNTKLKESSMLFSKSQKSSLWQRYWIAVTVGSRPC